MPFPDLAAAHRFFGRDSLAARTWAEVLEPAADGYRPEFRRDDMIASMHDHDAAPNYDDAWARVACPALLVIGHSGSIRGDDVVRMQSLKPDLLVATVRDAGHDVHLDNPLGWRAVAEPFLREFLADDQPLPRSEGRS